MFDSCFLFLVGIERVSEALILVSQNDIMGFGFPRIDEICVCKNQFVLWEKRNSRGMLIWEELL